MATYRHIKPWTKRDHAGKVWPGYYSSGLMQSRDSGALEQSNFDVMLARLGGESKTVIVVWDRHSTVGWVEWILIHSSDEKALAIADEQQEHLAQYPVLDEEDWSMREEESADDVQQDREY